jgi:hypothetical protein
MIIRKSIIAAALAAATFTAVVPATSFAHDGGRRHHYNGNGHGHGRDRYVDRRGYRDDRGYRCRKSGGTTGLLVGGVAGALLGRAVDTRGDRAPGTIIGAGAGALAGRAIDRNSRC